MKLIKLLKKMKGHQYITIMNGSGNFKIDATVLECWVEYDMINNNDWEMKLYKSKVVEIESKECSENSGINEIIIVIDYKEDK